MPLPSHTCTQLRAGAGPGAEASAQGPTAGKLPAARRATAVGEGPSSLRAPWDSAPPTPARMSVHPCPPSQRPPSHV